MGSIRLFALGFFQNNDPVDLDPELPISSYRSSLKGPQRRAHGRTQRAFPNRVSSAWLCPQPLSDKVFTINTGARTTQNQPGRIVSLLASFPFNPSDFPFAGRLPGAWDPSGYEPTTGPVSSP